MRIVIVFIACFLYSFGLTAQSPRYYSSSEIFQKIKKLNVLGSVLYVAAHPDDENTRLIAYLSNDKLYRTAYLSRTRGDGGQNLIGNEQGVELGLIRTQELLAARRIDGGEQFFTTAYDFGYSKGPEETLQFWDKEKILSDVVWIIRKFRPDVIITRFPTTGEGGHGHHTSSAILAEEAFDAAADPARFSEQLKQGVTVWQPRRLLWNTFNFGGNNTIREGQFRIDAGGYNPLLGESYGEIAARSRSQHKSQGFGVSASRGVAYEYFVPIKGDAPEGNLLSGIDVSWARTGHPEIGQMISRIEADYVMTDPAKSVPQLLSLYKAVSNLPHSVWRDQKLKEIKSVITECAGLFMEAFSQNQFVIPGKKASVTFSINNRSGVPVSVGNVVFMQRTSEGMGKLKIDTTYNKVLDVIIPSETSISQPYWLREPMTKGTFTVKDQQLIGHPENDPLFVSVILNFGDVNIDYKIPVKFKFSDPVKGEVHQPLFVIPAAEIKSSPDIAVSMNKEPVPISTQTIRNDSALRIEKVLTDKSSDVKEISQSASRYFIDKKNTAEPIRFSVKTSEGIYDKYKTVIEYPHIPDIIYFHEAVTKLVAVDLKVSGKNAGFIPGAGDKIPEALRQLGYNVTVLQQEDFGKTNLHQFDVIITGVRAYNVHPWLNDVHEQLMQYVKDGGVLFVQYNTNSNLGPVKAKIGPYPFDIVRTRVTEEDAAVNFIQSANKLLSYPNTITEKDFDNWIQERSIYHAAGFGDHYQGLFSMHDKNEKPDAGSLIYCDYGKGRFIYSGLVFFRELPAGVPGAYRLFSNLIAKPK